MNFLELCLKRSSIRSYTDEKVSSEDLEYILKCAQYAPSAVNYQPWKFYIVESQEGKSAVQKAYERDWFKTAPLYIVAVIEHSESWKRKTDNKDHGEIDIAIAVEHICLAAAEKGLGTCWVCNFEPQIIKDFLKLSDTQEPAVLIPLGHISKDFQPKEKQRKTLKEIVF